MARKKEPQAVAPRQEQYRAIDSLTPYARNARTHSAVQVQQIAASIAAFGWTSPVLADPDGIVAGHGRILGAELIYAAGGRIARPDGQLIPDGTVPVLDCSGWTPAQRRAYILADNQIALNAGWDDGLLRSELQALVDDGFDIDLTGFTAEDLAALTPDGGDPGGPSGDAARATLADRFLIAPFSVLNAREGWWQDRKRAWLSLGIRSELGRGGGSGTPPHPPTVTQNADGTLNYGGTAGQASRFDRQRQGKKAAGGGHPQAVARGRRPTTASASAAAGRGGQSE